MNLRKRSFWTAVNGDAGTRTQSRLAQFADKCAAHADHGGRGALGIDDTVVYEHASLSGSRVLRRKCVREGNMLFSDETHGDAGSDSTIEEV
jgi:hypothetical protein